MPGGIAMEKAGQSWKYESVASFPDFGAPLTDGVVSLRHFTLDDVSEVARSPRPRDCTVDRIITDPVLGVRRSWRD